MRHLFSTLVIPVIDLALSGYLFNKIKTHRLHIKWLIPLIIWIALSTFISDHFIQTLTAKNLFQILTSVIICITIAAAFGVEKRSVAFWTSLYLSCSVLAACFVIALQGMDFFGGLIPLEAYYYYSIGSIIASGLKVLFMLLFTIWIWNSGLMFNKFLSRKMKVLFWLLLLAGVGVLSGVFLIAQNQRIASWYGRLGIWGADIAFCLFIIFLLHAFRKAGENLDEALKEQSGALVTEGLLAHFSELENEEARLAVMQDRLSRSRGDAVEVMLERGQVLFTHNCLLNYLLNQKVREAKEKGIEIEVSAFIPSHLGVASNVLAALMENLLELAISLSARQTKGVKKIMVKVWVSGKNLMINVDTVVSSGFGLNDKERLCLKCGKKILATQNGAYREWFEDSCYFVSVALLDVIVAV